MYYIFNSENKMIGYCDFEPNHEDLESRKEVAIESSKAYKNPFSLFIENGEIVEPLIPEKTEQQLLEEQTQKILKNRDIELSKTDWMFNRQLEQTMLNINTNLTEGQFNKLLEYRQALRDITSVPEYPFVELPSLNLEE